MVESGQPSEEQPGGEQPPELRPLSQLIGMHVARERARRYMSQGELASRLGITQQTLSRLERGVGQPTTATVERVFAAMGLQVRVEVEPLDTGLDAEIAKYTAMPDDERAEEIGYFALLLDRLGDLPYTLTGRLGAFLQGAPLRVVFADIIVAAADLDLYAAWFDRQQAMRWNEKWLDYGYRSCDPREEGPPRWMIGAHEMRMELRDDAPSSSVVVRVGEREVRVLPLPAIEAAYPDIGRVMERVRALGVR